MSFISPLVWGNTTSLLEKHDENIVGGNQYMKTRKEKTKAQKALHHGFKFETALNNIRHRVELCPFYISNPLTNNESILSINAKRYFDWDTLPIGVDACSASSNTVGQLPLDRRVRKRQQLMNIMSFIVPFLKDGMIVVDFCCGCGHQSIPLAYHFPKCTFILLDCKKRSLDFAELRIKQLNLKNVRLYHDTIENFQEPFDIGCALHACGDATDQVHAKCLAMKAIYVLIPCCVGKVSKGSVKYPRSSLCREILTQKQYFSIAKAADFGHSGFDPLGDCCHEKKETGKKPNSFQCESTEMLMELNIMRSNSTTDASMPTLNIPHADRSESSNPSPAPVPSHNMQLRYSRRNAKSFIEQERNMLAIEGGYRTLLMICHPQTCTPKNDVIVGVHNEDLTNIALMEAFTR